MLHAFHERYEYHARCMHSMSAISEQRCLLGLQLAEDRLPTYSRPKKLLAVMVAGEVRS